MKITKSLLKSLVETSSSPIFTDNLKSDLYDYIDGIENYISKFIPYEKFKKDTAINVDFDDENRIAITKNSEIKVSNYSVWSGKIGKLFDNNIVAVFNYNQIAVFDEDLNLIKAFPDIYTKEYIATCGANDFSYIAITPNYNQVDVYKYNGDDLVYLFSIGDGTQAIDMTDFQNKLNSIRGVGISIDDSGNIEVYIANRYGGDNDNGCVVKYVRDESGNEIDYKVLLYSPHNRGLKYGEINNPYYLYLYENKLYLIDNEDIAIFNLENERIEYVNSRNLVKSKLIVEFIPNYLLVNQYGRNEIYEFDLENYNLIKLTECNPSYLYLDGNYLYFRDGLLMKGCKIINFVNISEFETEPIQVKGIIHHFYTIPSNDDDDIEILIDRGNGYEIVNKYYNFIDVNGEVKVKIRKSNTGTGFKVNAVNFIVKTE